MASFIATIKRRAERSIRLIELIKDSYKESRTQPPLESDSWIRISSLGTVCPREEVLCSIHNKERSDVIDGDSGMNFEHGHAVHWMMQSRVLPNVGVIIGAWRCTFCGTQYGSRQEGYIPRPDRCHRCGAIAGERPRYDGRPDLNVNDNAFVFVEEWIGNFTHRIGGSPDGQMILEYHKDYTPADLTLLEIKSCNDDNFYKYEKAPDFVHVIQSQLYMWLCEYRKAKLVYFNKNEKGTKGLAEHDIEYDEECIERVLSAVSEIRNGIKDTVVPERVVCASPDCSRAWRCQVRDLCFSE